MPMAEASRGPLYPKRRVTRGPSSPTASIRPPNIRVQTLVGTVTYRKQSPLRHQISHSFIPWVPVNDNATSGSALSKHHSFLGSKLSDLLHLGRAERYKGCDVKSVIALSAPAPGGLLKSKVPNERTLFV